MYIPDSYVSNIQERLNLYQQLDKIDQESGIEKFSPGLLERFGPIPSAVFELFEGLRVRWIAKEMGFERVVIKKKKLQAFFISIPNSPYFESPYFQHLLKVISADKTEFPFVLKQSTNNLILIKENIKSLLRAKTLLADIHQQVIQSLENK